MATLIRAWIAATLMALAAAPDAGADPRWVADAGSGSLRFVATQAGARFEGGFRDFSLRFDFDPAHPESARLEVLVRVASVDTADAERDEILRGSDFFWTQQQPQALYRATRLRRDGAGWLAEGELTLRGVTQPVSVKFDFRPGDGRATMTGSARIRRLPFGIGQGEWASTEWIGDAVEIRFDLSLRPATI